MRPTFDHLPHRTCSKVPCGKGLRLRGVGAGDQPARGGAVWAVSSKTSDRHRRKSGLGPVSVLRRLGLLRCSREKRVVEGATRFYPTGAHDVSPTDRSVGRVIDNGQKARYVVGIGVYPGITAASAGVNEIATTVLDVIGAVAIKIEAIGGESRRLWAKWSQWLVIVKPETVIKQYCGRLELR